MKSIQVTGAGVVASILLCLGFVLCPETVRAEPVSLRVVAGGDAMFGRHTTRGFRPCGGAEALGKISHLLVGDVVLVNLETPVTTGTLDELGVKASSRGLTFQAAPEHLEGLRRAGVSAVSLANNHAEDCGDQAMAKTVSLTTRAGLKSAGISLDGDPFEPTRWSVGGGDVALLSATTKRNKGNLAPGAKTPLAFRPFQEMKRLLPERVRAHRARHPEDLLIVALHWGAEGEARPDPGQRKLAHQLIDAGANAVVGHHPHVLQPVESYGDGLILYSTGNLVFDMRGQKSRESALFTMTFHRKNGGGYVAAELVVQPLRITGPNHRPEPVDDQLAFMKTLQRLSSGIFRTNLKWLDDQLVWNAQGRNEQ